MPAPKTSPAHISSCQLSAGSSASPPLKLINFHTNFSPSPNPSALTATAGTSSRDCLRVLPQHVQPLTPLNCRNKSGPRCSFSPHNHKDPVSQTPFLPPQPQGSHLPPWCLAKVTNSDCATIRLPLRPTSTNCRPLTASNPSPQVLAPHWPLPARTGREGKPLIGRECSSPGEGEACRKTGACPEAGLELPGRGVRVPCSRGGNRP